MLDVYVLLSVFCVFIFVVLGGLNHDLGVVGYKGLYS